MVESIEPEVLIEEVTSDVAPELDAHLTSLRDHGRDDFRIGQLNRLVASMITGCRVLDFGCGTGALTLHLLESGLNVVSVDVSESLVQLARSLLEQAGRSPKNVMRVPIDLPSEAIVSRFGRFDSVVSLDVLEHIQDDVAALRRLRDCIADGGRLVLSVPALPALYGERDRAIGHCRRYTKVSLNRSLRAAGFEPQRMRYWNVLGVVPVWIAVQRGSSINEEFRYSRSSYAQRLLNDALRMWFRLVENHLSPPLGLTLIASAVPSRGN